MRVSDKAIVLQSVKHGDNKYILRLYTHHNGLISVVAVAGKSPSSKIRTGHLLPLNFIEAEIVFKQNKDVQQLTEATCYHNNPGISLSLVKLSLAQLMNEVLIKCLKEQQPNLHLFEFIEASFGYLNESEDNIANFHVYFLAELAKHLGFGPRNNFSGSNPYFDCRNGDFSVLSLAFPLGLNQEDSRLLSEFLKANNVDVRLSGTQRRTLLDILLAYYGLHVPGFSNIKSLEVLKEVLRD
jgi:DNA repair protein RecO (recombination protein O)